MVIASVDDEIECLVHPVRRSFGAEIIQNQQLRFHDRPDHLDLRRLDDGIVGIANPAEEFPRVAELRLSCRVLNHRLQNRNGKMRLADTRSAQQQQPFVEHGERSREGPGLCHGRHQRVTVVLEVVERAGLIARGNARVSHGLRDSVLTPAVAPDDSSDTVILERSPAGVIAERTSHSIYNQ